MSAAAMMRNTCTLERGTNSQSQYGTAVKAYAPVLSTVGGIPCSFQTNSGSSGNYQQRVQGFRQCSVFFPAGTDVRFSDRILNITGVDGISASDLFQVDSPPEDHAGRAAYRMVTATEVND